MLASALYLHRSLFGAHSLVWALDVVIQHVAGVTVLVNHCVLISSYRTLLNLSSSLALSTVELLLDHMLYQFLVVRADVIGFGKSSNHGFTQLLFTLGIQCWIVWYRWYVIQRLVELRLTGGTALIHDLPSCHVVSSQVFILRYPRSFALTTFTNTLVSLRLFHTHIISSSVLCFSESHVLIRSVSSSLAFPILFILISK
jgi:hypothetical protein